VPEICEVPAPLAEGNLLSSVVLGCVLRDTYTGLARIAPSRHRRLGPPSLCTNAAFWRDTFVHERSLLARHIQDAALEWESEQINFEVGNHGSVVESDFYTKLKKLDIQEGKKDKLFADHVTQVYEVHNRVIVSFLQQVQRGTVASREVETGK